ncbi:MAG: flavin reductase family protein [Cytophagales bacterium]|nr:flavin reductase family protein [Cytophagales bacterium]
MREKELTLRTDELDQMERLYRNNLINSISGFKSANLLGSVDENGRANLAIFSSVTHFGSNPPLLGFVVRPPVVPRHTYENLKSTGYFTINHVHRDHIIRAHQTSAKYDQSVDEFEQCGFVKEMSDLHPVPYVRRAPIKIGLSFEEEYPVKANGTILVLGKIIELKALPSVIKEDGFVDLAEAGSVTINGLDSYLLPEKLARFTYARPPQNLERTL